MSIYYFVRSKGRVNLGSFEVVYKGVLHNKYFFVANYNRMYDYIVHTKVHTKNQ